MTKRQELLFTRTRTRSRVGWCRVCTRACTPPHAASGTGDTAAPLPLRNAALRRGLHPRHTQLATARGVRLACNARSRPMRLAPESTPRPTDTRTRHALAIRASAMDTTPRPCRVWPPRTSPRLTPSAMAPHLAHPSCHALLARQPPRCRCHSPTPRDVASQRHVVGAPSPTIGMHAPHLPWRRGRCGCRCPGAVAATQQPAGKLSTWPVSERGCPMTL